MKSIKREKVPLRFVLSTNTTKAPTVLKLPKSPYHHGRGYIDKIVEVVKQGKVREIADVRDETDLSGLKLTLDLKRGTDLMHSCKAVPYHAASRQFCLQLQRVDCGCSGVMGIREILEEWVAFRMECVRRRIFELSKKKKSCICYKVFRKSF